MMFVNKCFVDIRSRIFIIMFDSNLRFPYLYHNGNLFHYEDDFLIVLIIN